MSANEIEDNKAELDALVKLFAEDADTDVLIYNSPIARDVDSALITTCARRSCRKNVLFVIVTEGGDPDAAYRIGRCLQEAYEHVTCFVTGYCKSAGTIVAIGAHELVISDHGELGPIDVQMSKKDDLFGYESGLTVMASLKSLHERALSAFEHFFINIQAKSAGRVTLKTATEMSAKLTEGLFAPLYAQLDPIHIGEAERATSIAREYALRLNVMSQNLQADSLDEMIGAFPSHGFVIDRAEAESLFVRVREPNAMEAKLQELLGDVALIPRTGTQSPVVKYLNYKKEASDETHKEKGQNDGSNGVRKIEEAESNTSAE